MKVGLMNNPSRGLAEQIEFIGKAGYDFVDLTIEAPMAHQVAPEAIIPVLDRYGLSVVGHTDPCLPFAYPVERVRIACMRELERCAKIFTALGARVMNIHPCYSRPPRMKQALVELNVKALRPIVEMVLSYGLTPALENFRPPFDSVSVFELMLRQNPGLKFHLDFGHANIGQDKGESFCHHLGEHIAHVHFSDNRSSDDHHMPLGVGTIPWKKAVHSLKAAGYDGTITLEVFCEDDSVLYDYLEISRRLLLALWDDEGADDRQAKQRSGC